MHENKQMGIFNRQILLDFSEKLLLVIVDFLDYYRLSGLFWGISHINSLFFELSDNQRLHLWLLRDI